MSKIVPINRERHGRKAWRRPSGYEFAANLAVVPLGGWEFSQAIATMPIGFMERSPGNYLTVALMALSMGTNVFVGPGGQWMGGYVPAVLRTYPFSLIHAGGDGGQQELGIDEDSGVVVDDTGGEGVEKFFEADGTPTATLKSIMEMLRLIENDQARTDEAVSALAEAGLIKPWPLKVQVGNQEVTVNGLHCIDEAALNVLDDATFLKMRRASSLVIAYGQLLSMVQVQGLARMTLLKQQMAQTEKRASDMLPV